MVFTNLACGTVGVLGASNAGAFLAGPTVEAGAVRVARYT